MQANNISVISIIVISLLGGCGSHEPSQSVVQPLDHRLSCEQLDFALRQNEADRAALAARRDGLSWNRVMVNLSLGYIDNQSEPEAELHRRAVYLKDVYQTRDCRNEQTAQISAQPAAYASMPAPAGYYYPQPQPVPAPVYYQYAPALQAADAGPVAAVLAAPYSEAHLRDSAYLFR